VWVVEGLQDDKWAMVSKVHHCMVDGVSGTQIYHLLLSASPDEKLPEDLPEPWHPATPPSRALVTADAVRELATSPLRLAALVGDALRAPRDSAGRAADVIRGAVALSFNARPAKASTLIGEVGRQRRYAAVSASLRQVKAVCETYGVTVNDVALTAATAAFRSLLLARGEPCNPNTVRSLVPVSVRARGDEGILDNRVSCLLADLPVHVREPVDRLRAVHAHLAHLKTLKEAEAGAAVNDLATREPFVFVAPLVRIAFRLPQRNIVTVTTNVPGPRDALYLLGRRMVRLLPYVPIASRVRIGVAILSYCDELTFGVTGDYDTADVGLLSREISRALDELLAEAERTSADRETRDGRGVDPAAHRLQVAAMDHGDLRRGVAQ